MVSALMLLLVAQELSWMEWEGVPKLLSVVKPLHVKHTVIYLPDKKSGKPTRQIGEAIHVWIDTKRIGKVYITVRRGEHLGPKWEKEVRGFSDVTKRTLVKMRENISSFQKHRGENLLIATDVLQTQNALLINERGRHSILFTDGLTTITNMGSAADGRLYRPLELAKSFAILEKAILQKNKGHFSKPLMERQGHLIKVVNADLFPELLYEKTPEERDRILREYWTEVGEFACRYYEEYVAYFLELTEKLK